MANKKITVTVLGCGTSAGVPMIHPDNKNGWGACNPNNPKNRRRRCSIAMQTNDCHILVDAGTDLKDQIVDYGKVDFDALFITHQHADHVHGIDDLRWICTINNSALKTYATKETFDDIKLRFKYAFDPLPTVINNYFKPVLQDIEIKDKIVVNNSSFTIINQIHGAISSVGYRYGDFAYCTDIVDFEEEEFEKLRGLKVWIIDVLRKEPHKTHAHLDKVLQWVKELKPEKTYLTHMDYSMDYDELMKILPDNIEPAYDGLVIEI